MPFEEFLTGGLTGGAGDMFSDADSSTTAVNQNDYSTITAPMGYKNPSPVHKEGFGGFNVGPYESQATKMVKYGAIAVAVVAVGYFLIKG